MEKNQIRFLNEVMNEPEKHEKALKLFQETYEGLQIGDYSMLDVIVDIVQNGTSNIERSFKAVASDQLDKSGVTSPLLKANLLKGCDEVLKQFQESIEGLINSAIKVNKKVDFDRITKTQMQAQGIYVAANCMRYIYPEYKILQIGRVPGGLATKCNKDFDLESSRIRLDRNEDTYYLYARLPRSGGGASLVVFTEPKENTEKDLYIFWQSGLFDQIKF